VEGRGSVILGDVHPGSLLLLIPLSLLLLLMLY